MQLKCFTTQKKHIITISHVVFSLVKSGKYRGGKHNIAADSEPSNVRDLTFSVGKCEECPLISLSTG